MNTVREIQKLNERELSMGLPLSASWHAQYLKSPWVFVGGLPYELTEGDVICVMSQCGEVEYIHLLRDKTTGKSIGSAFLKYEDCRSAVLAVDNFNGVQVWSWGLVGGGVCCSCSIGRVRRACCCGCWHTDSAWYTIGSVVVVV